MSYENLEKWLGLADEIDRREGLIAYERYHQVMLRFSNKYGYPLDRVIGAFVALSPNNDYYGNLRSLASVLDGNNQGIPDEAITITGYKHCRNRALRYARGDCAFLEDAKGLKTRAFYQNVLDPTNPFPVTIDGHIGAVWRDKRQTMKEALVPPALYQTIQAGIHRLAGATGMISNQVQATLWFTRKRIHHVKYDAQLELFQSKDDIWKTLVDVDTLKPYDFKL